LTPWGSAGTAAAAASRAGSPAGAPAAASSAHTCAALVASSVEMPTVCASMGRRLTPALAAAAISAAALLWCALPPDVDTVKVSKKGAGEPPLMV